MAHCPRGPVVHRGPIGANALAVGLLVYGLHTVSTLPRF